MGEAVKHITNVTSNFIPAKWFLLDSSLAKSSRFHLIVLLSRHFGLFTMKETMSLFLCGMIEWLTGEGLLNQSCNNSIFRVISSYTTNSVPDQLIRERERGKLLDFSSSKLGADE